MTVEGGKPSTIVVDRKPVPGVLFATKVNGQQVFAKLEGRTDLQKLVDDYEAELRGAEMARKAALNAAVPGLDEVMAAAAAAYNEDARYRNEFSAMMEDEGNDGARPPRPLDQSPSQRLQALQEQYPRAALYLRAKRQSESASWADNTGKGAAGRLAMEILASGGDIKDAEAALNARREFVD
jgi:leucyl aminopeptidase (aminopeptidase T)